MSTARPADGRGPTDDGGRSDEAGPSGDAGPSGEEAEEVLVGGTTTVVRIGATVRRPARSWTPAARALLKCWEAAGVVGTPRWHGIDDQGREVLDFLPGEVGNYPLSAQVRSTSALTSAARLLRRLHDASAPLIGVDLPWQLPALDPVEVVCHGDFAPYNCVFADGVTVGVIDVDAARPGPRAWDLAYAIYRFAPLTAATNPVGFGDAAARRRRVGAFLEAYGCTPAQARAAVETVAPRLRSLVDFMYERAASGDAAFAGHIEAGHDRLYLDDIVHVEEQLDALRAVAASAGAGGAPGT